MSLLRAHLAKRGALTTAELPEVEHGTWVLVGGVVTHRQRPPTAGGVTFLNLEDETGMANVICSPGLWDRYRVLASSATALLVRGRIESDHGGAVVNIQADQLLALDLAAVLSRSRDYT
ncbi:OB-fold nucleic acid binding domain-containing protein [Saccharothrix saharensis]|uniref:OB-fold nucleic acid binding domain-containing protein n=1 Tax=Saccharothrix saharensis TaxID=571190 RepID=UPI0011526025|nr:OB-fold nucleic acid binding domain-containing protein [Saccharothrix saharensis]